MPDGTALAVFALASAAVIVVPGPSVVYVLGRTLADGRAAGLRAVLSNACGSMVLVAAVAGGLGVLVQGSALAFTVVKVVGAVYLVHLGLTTWRSAGSPARAERTDDGPARGRFREGLVVGLSNPKTVVFFMAFLPQFVTPEGPVPLQMLALGLVFNLLALVSDGAWVLIADLARERVTSARGLHVLRRVGGLALIGLGGALLATSRRL